LLFGGRAQPADGSLTLQAAHALFQALQVDVVCRIAASIGCGIGRATFAQGRPARALRDWRFPELQRAIGKVGEIGFPLLVTRRNKKAWRRRIIIGAMRGIGGRPVSLGCIRRAN
jgi:hypothetical protein